MLTRSRLLIFFVTAFAVSLFAAKFWDSKDFTEWSEKECMEVLRKSPWAYSNTFGRVQSVMLDSPTATENPGPVKPPTWGEAERSDVIEFQLLSAKPVRMALARLQLLRRPNDTALREQAIKFVNQGYENQVVVQISYRSFPPGSQAVSDIHSFFLTATLADFRTDTQLTVDKNHVISLAEYWPPGPNRSNACFVFPRRSDSGTPNFSGNEKSITLRSKFSPSIRGNKQTYDIFVKMNPRDMRFRKEFEF